MDIVVCIKQVPATTDVTIDPHTGTLIREGVDVELNPFDLYAIEEGIRIKERYGGTVTSITMGPPQAERALRASLALGCDKAVLLTDRAFAGADTWATAYTLKQAVEKLGMYDLVICGLKTTDGDTGQVGPQLAEMLDIPHVSYVRKIYTIDGDKLYLERTLDIVHEDIEVPFPCLITVTKEVNEPRLPSFKRKLQAKKMLLNIWTKEDLEGDIAKYGLDGSPLSVVRVFDPPRRPGGEILSGNPTKQVKSLIERLDERRLL